MAERVTTDALRVFGDRVQPDELERCAKVAVADLWRDSVKVTTFIPVLALRQIREMLDTRPHVETTDTAMP